MLFIIFEELTIIYKRSENFICVARPYDQALGEIAVPPIAGVVTSGDVTHIILYAVAGHLHAANINNLSTQ